MHVSFNGVDPQFLRDNDTNNVTKILKKKDRWSLKNKEIILQQKIIFDHHNHKNQRSITPRFSLSSVGILPGFQ